MSLLIIDSAQEATVSYIPEDLWESSVCLRDYPDEESLTRLLEESDQGKVLELVVCLFTLPERGYELPDFIKRLREHTEIPLIFSREYDDAKSTLTRGTHIQKKDGTLDSGLYLIEGPIDTNQYRHVAALLHNQGLPLSIRISYEDGENLLEREGLGLYEEFFQELGSLRVQDSDIPELCVDSERKTVQMDINNNVQMSVASLLQCYGHNVLGKPREVFLHTIRAD